MADEPKIGEERRHHDEPDMTTAPDAICSIAAVEHLVEPAPLAALPDDSVTLDNEIPPRRAAATRSSSKTTATERARHGHVEHLIRPGPRIYLPGR